MGHSLENCHFWGNVCKKVPVFLKARPKIAEELPPNAMPDLREARKSHVPLRLRNDGTRARELSRLIHCS